MGRCPATRQAFDLVYTSQGVLCWLQNLDVWAAAIVGSLRPGGRLYVYETHPLAYALDDEAEGNALTLRYPYLSQGEALEFNQPGSYTDCEHTTTANATREWPWGLGEVVGALLPRGCGCDGYASTRRASSQWCRR